MYFILFAEKKVSKSCHVTAQLPSTLFYKLSAAERGMTRSPFNQLIGITAWHWRACYKPTKMCRRKNSPPHRIELKSQKQIFVFHKHTALHSNAGIACVIKNYRCNVWKECEGMWKDEETGNFSILLTAITRMWKVWRRTQKSLTCCLIGSAFMNLWTLENSPNAAHWNFRDFFY